MTSTPTIARRSSLPHWESIPADVPSAVRQVKAAIRARIGASGRSVEEVVATVAARVRVEVDDIVAAKARGETVWPVIDYGDIADGAVDGDQLARLRRRGCLVVRGHFEREQALAWDRGIVRYVESNRFFERYRGPADDFFGTVGSKPEIYPIYWSHAQMEARQSVRMATVQAFLNRLWRFESDGVQWFDPDRDSLYPDRIRRRPEGITSRGLGTHLDPGTLDLWMTAGLPAGVPAPVRRHGRGVRPVGRRPPHRRPAVPRLDDVLGVPDVPGLDGAVGHGPRPRGAASRADPGGDGVPAAAAAPRRRRRRRHVRGRREQGLPGERAVALRAARGAQGIPDIRAGDSVWWHCDMIHGVAPSATSGAGATSCTSRRLRGARATRPTPSRAAPRSSLARARRTSRPSTTSGDGPIASAWRSSTPPAAAGVGLDA